MAHLNFATGAKSNDENLKFKKPLRTEFRFIIYVTNRAGLELQRAGEGRADQIRPVQVSESDAIKMLKAIQIYKIDKFHTAAIFISQSNLIKILNVFTEYVRWAYPLVSPLLFKV